ncbi:Fe-S oxidoreductase, partial [mine drainage metagenome]
MHMPNKTLPLKIGPDGTFSEIVWQGVYNETKYFWRPAFTIQVGQEGETPEDLWETISMINVLSNSYSDGRPFEFTITPLLNVPLGRIKSHTLNRHVLSVDQLAVYYASYRHLAKMAA